MSDSIKLALLKNIAFKEKIKLLFHNNLFVKYYYFNIIIANNFYATNCKSSC